MMADDRDPFLESLFAEAKAELDGESFTSEAIAQPQRLKHRLLAGGVCVALLLGLCVWQLALPVQEFALLFTQVLGTSLLELGDGTLAWILSPVNNIASGLILLGKIVRVGWKRITAATYAY